MKLRTSILLLAVTAILPATVLADPPDTLQRVHCNNTVLQGDYAFRVSGEILPPGGNPTLRDGVAMTHFDGHGGLTQVDFVVGDGVPVPGETDPFTGFHVDEGGTYRVYPDCTGEAEIDTPSDGSGARIILKFVIGRGGRTIHTIVSQLFPPGADTPIPASIHSDAERLQ